MIFGTRFHFYKQCQKANKFISEFIADHCRLRTRCEFGDLFDQVLRNRFVCGIKSQETQKKFTAEDGPTISRMQELAQGMEAAKKKEIIVIF